MRYYTPVQRPEARRLPLFSARIAAGFPSPADDHLEGELDLNELLIQNGPATFFVRARGDSMNGDRPTIQDGDLLVVDKSRTPKSGDVVVACLDGAFTVKRLRRTAEGVWLLQRTKASQRFASWMGRSSASGVVTARISQFH
jgi:DNA polymerase V